MTGTVYLKEEVSTSNPRETMAYSLSDYHLQQPVGQTVNIGHISLSTLPAKMMMLHSSRLKRAGSDAKETQSLLL
jgi:hypothetical protein